MTDAARSTDTESQPLRLKDMTPDALAARFAADSRLIVPVGAIALTSSAVPVGASTLIVERLADDLSAEFRVVRAPTIEYGINVATKERHAGDVSLRKKTLHRLVNDLTASWECSGVSEIIFLTAHGADAHLEALATVGAAKARIRSVDLFAVNLSDLVGVRRSEDDRGDVYLALLCFLAPSVVLASETERDELARRGEALYSRMRSRIRERIFLAPAPSE